MGYIYRKPPEYKMSQALDTRAEDVYQAYVLRLWHEETSQGWRVSLLPVAEDGPAHHFKDIETFMSFLEKQADLVLPQATLEQLKTGPLSPLEK